MADNLLSSFLPDDRASFGIFPQMKPRRRFQDPTGAANVPLDVIRGRVAGLAGLLPDVLNFMGRSPMPTEQFGETQYEPAQQLPYGSEYFLQNLPLKPTSRIGEVAGQAGAFVPLNPMPAARAVAAGVKALGPTAVRMGEGYLQSRGLMPGVVPEAPVPPATPLASMIEKPQAPVSELGFYSAAEQAALNLPRKSGTGESFFNDLMKGQDVKKDELSWLGLDDYLKGKPNVTRQEVQDFIANNRVDVREVSYGSIDFTKLSDTQLRNEYPLRIRGYQPIDYDGNPMSREQMISDLLSAPVDIGADLTQYASLQLPGGQNYREILLTLPKKQPKIVPLEGGGGSWGVQMPDGTITSRYYDWNDAAQALRFDAQKSGVTYLSSHFNEPNILAHMRVNDRVDADGKKMLLIEEIQSDWHQGGKLKGYNTPEKRAAEQKKLDDLIIERQQLGERQKQLEELASPYTSQGDEWNSVSNRLQRLQTEQNRLLRTFGDGVPDAPFKDTWHQLALKRALKYAADNGYDRVGLTTGKQQIERYSDKLRQNISQIEFQTGTKLSPSEASELQALRNKPHSEMRGNDRARMNYLSDNEGMFVKPNETRINAFNGSRPAFSGTVAYGKFLDGPAQGKTVEEVLGSSIAKQIAEKPFGTILGENLSVGGEGMKKYYDEIYPAFLAKQGKKYNAKTGETRIKTGQGIPGGASIRYIDISPEMRGGVKKGQPLFTAAPIGGIGLGAGTQDQQQNSINSFIQ